MERLSKRAFTFGIVLFMLALLVSSATEDTAKSGNTENVVAKDGQKNLGSETERTEEKIPINGTTVQKPDKTVAEEPTQNCTAVNGTECVDDRSFVTRFWEQMASNRDMLFRTMYVLLGVTGIVILYFIVRAVRLRRKRSKSRKYGVITTRGDLEMEPLGQGDDEDEDYTVFEMNGRAK